MRMIMITGQKPIMTARQARFQIVDVIASMKPLTKMTRQIVSAAEHSVHRARGVPHGPELFLGFAGAHRGARAGRAFSP